jgi:hypothetical protein
MINPLTRARSLLLGQHTDECSQLSRLAGVRVDLRLDEKEFD